MSKKTPAATTSDTSAPDTTAADLAQKKAADAKAEKDKKAADAKAEKDKKAADAKAAADKKAAVAADKAAKVKAAEDAKAAKQAARQPEQNGVRRPGPDGQCGKAWGVFDNLSRQLGRPVPIADALVEGEKGGLNGGNIRTEYARWKKFNGISGRVAVPVVTPPVASAPATGQTAAPATAAQ